MNFTKGNVLDIPKIYICHQVNCRGVMGSGLAKQIKIKWKKAYDWYIKYCNNKTAKELLGTICSVSVEDNIQIIHMFAQDGYGTDKRYTDYEAFKKCLEAIKFYIPKENSILRFPYGIGCGLGGGDWEIIKNLIEEILDGYNIIIYQL